VGYSCTWWRRHLEEEEEGPREEAAPAPEGQDLDKELEDYMKKRQQN
jgi:hypothetical protein